MSVIKNRNNTNVYTTLNSKTVELSSTFLVWVSASLRMLTAIQPAVLASSHSNIVFCSPQLFSLTNWRARWLCRSLVCISDTILHSWGKQFSEKKTRILRWTWKCTSSQLIFWSDHVQLYENILQYFVKTLIYG